MSNREDAESRQVGGTHYHEMAVQPWQAMESCLTTDQFKGYLIGTAIAYLMRFNATAAGKGGMQDIRKAVHTLERLLQTEAT